MGLPSSMSLAISVPVIEENLRDYGQESACLKVRASEVEVLDLEIDGSSARDKISNEIACSLREEQPVVVVPGCAGMAGLAVSYRNPIMFPSLMAWPLP